jgi:hypothetical protein
VTQPPEDPIKALWQGQHPETDRMTLQAIRALARTYTDGVRDRMLMTVALIVVETAIFGVLAWRAPNAPMRVGYLLVLVGLAWMAWRVWARRPGRLPGAESSAATLLDFHRKQLLRQRFSYGDMLVATGPTIAGLVVVIYGMHVLRPQAGWDKFGPFFVLMALWFVGAWIVQRRQARRLRDRIDEVDGFGGR